MSFWHKCEICKCDPGPFFIWTTSRYFPKEKYIKILKLRTKGELDNNFKEGRTVCFECYRKLKEKE